MCAAQWTCQSKRIPVPKVHVAPIFPQYTSVGMAKTALSKSKHRVANRRLTMKPAHDHHQPDYEEFKPPQQDSPRHILNALNDDCLERVFKELELFDLTMAADVCVRFQQHAIEAFKLKYKHMVKIDDYAEFNYRPAKFEMMLRNFGSLIHTLNIENKILRARAIDLLKMLNKYAPALKNLGLMRFNIAGNVNDVRPLFAMLEKLTFFDCKFTNGAEKLLAPCAEVTHLTMSGVNWDNCIINQSFPKLQELHMARCSSMEDDELEKFITLNPALKVLSIDNNDELGSVKIIQSIGEHLKELEELEILQKYSERARIIQLSFASLSQLCSLKKLTLHFSGHSITPLLMKLAEKAVPLEDLSIYEGTLDSNTIKSICKLTKLNKIRLSDISNLADEHVTELAKGLPLLRAFHLKGWTKITTVGLRNMVAHAKTLSQLTLECRYYIPFIGMNDFRAMLKAVQDRPDKIKLEIKIIGDGKKVNVPKEVLSANRDWLWIDEDVEDIYRQFL